MIVQVKVWMDIAVDPDEYAVPSDGDVREEIEDADVVIIAKMVSISGKDRFKGKLDYLFEIQ